MELPALEGRGGQRPGWGEILLPSRVRSCYAD